MVGMNKSISRGSLTKVIERFYLFILFLHEFFEFTVSFVKIPFKCCICFDFFQSLSDFLTDIIENI